MASTQSELRALFDNQSAAMRTKDIDLLVSLYLYQQQPIDPAPAWTPAGALRLSPRE